MISDRLTDARMQMGHLKYQSSMYLLIIFMLFLTVQFNVEMDLYCCVTEYNVILTM